MNASAMEDAVIQALLELYWTILRMSNRSTDTLKIAPLNGHDFLQTFERELERSKYPRAIRFLQRLPYISYGYIAPSSEAINYLDTSPNYYSHHLSWLPLKWGEGPAVSADELPLIMQSDGVGTILVIDTSDWTARVYKSDMSEEGCQNHANKDDGPPLCRH